MILEIGNDQVNGIPRPEYPRPQFMRKEWLCLNGQWQFEIDCGDSGIERGLLTRELQDRINVPFCPESSLSGIHHTDFMNAVWYRKTVKIPEAWKGQRVLLNFQAVDYDTTIWVNEKEVARHRGGFTPFTCDLDGIAEAGETITIVVRARDDHRPPQARGKQSQRFGNHGCFYTRTTGIWQTVWMEPVPRSYLKRPRITPDVCNRMIRLEQAVAHVVPGLRIKATLKDASGVIASTLAVTDYDFVPQLYLNIPEERVRLWSPSDPHLYDLEIELLDAEGNVLDHAVSYAGLRSVVIHNKAIKINGETVFQRLVLDQGYYPDGIMTAPNDHALLYDIELSLAAGFNGARLHQKVFEERFLYYADKMGYLVWGEFADWGCGGYGADHDHQQPSETYITQWLEVLERDYSHPSIIGWCPLNETWQTISDRITSLDDVTRGMFLATKAMDVTRPVLDVSGYSHRVAESDVYDCHDYEQDPEKFKEKHQGLAEDDPMCNGPIVNPEFGCKKEFPWSVPYQGQPFFVSEFGGIWWNPNSKPGEDSWGYGNRPKSMAEFYERFEKLCGVLLDNEHMFGYCYTQLTDVHQEQNGLYSFDRKAKFDLDIIREAQLRTAAIEKIHHVLYSVKLPKVVNAGA